MKAFLMFKKQDFNMQQEMPWNQQALIQDLELNTLFNAMSNNDAFIFEVVKKAVLQSLTDLATINYRQDVLKDCLKNPSVVRDIYVLAGEAVGSRQKAWWATLSSSPSSILSNSIGLMQRFLETLGKLRKIADEHGRKFDSEGFSGFFSMLQKELTDEHLASLQNHLKELKFHDGILISAELSEGNEGANYVLRKSPGKSRSWFKRILALKTLAHRFRVDSHDIAGRKSLEEMRNRGINPVANAVAQAADNIENFLLGLRIETAFYLGCLNLYEQLAQIGEPIAFPQPRAVNEGRLSFDGLYDVGLALTMQQKIVGNEGRADNKGLVIITGANQGGKTTFLRSIGLAQLMMQCGMFVAAESFCASVSNGLFTHFKREEDVTMVSGKLDEELNRMSQIVDHIMPNSIVLFNESFAATSEREGSEIAKQIIEALLDKHIKAFFVTFLYEFAHGCYNRKMGNALFLLAERQIDGRRTFKLIEGEPLQTGYSEDLYNRIFGTEALSRYHF
jgi:DNA mismatch repair ATPase MutS